jgi:hypothetical protein
MYYNVFFYVNKKNNKGIFVLPDEMKGEYALKWNKKKKKGNSVFFSIIYVRKLESERRKTGH